MSHMSMFLFSPRYTTMYTITSWSHIYEFYDFKSWSGSSKFWIQVLQFTSLAHTEELKEVHLGNSRTLITATAITTRLSNTRVMSNMTRNTIVMSTATIFKWFASCTKSSKKGFQNREFGGVHLQDACLKGKNITFQIRWFSSTHTDYANSYLNPKVQWRELTTMLWGWRVEALV